MSINSIEHSLSICPKDTQCALRDSTGNTTQLSTTKAGDAIPQSHVNASQQLDPVTTKRLKRPRDSNGNLNQKCLRTPYGGRVGAGPRAKTAEDLNRDDHNLEPSIQRPKFVLSWDNIEEVQDSYSTAIQKGRLRYDRKPQCAPPGPFWDPYNLPQKLVRRARLNNTKLDEITESVKSFLQRVPEAVEWTAKTQEYMLTPGDVEAILQKAFIYHESSPKTHPEQQKLPPILKFAEKSLRRAMEFEGEDSISRRVVAVLRMVAYASFEVSVVAKECTVEEVESCLKPLAVGQQWLQRSRYFARFWRWVMANSLGWEGRELQLYLILVDGGRESSLRKLFQPIFPAGAGEFMWAISSEVYWKDLPATLPSLPDLIQIEMEALGKYVTHEIIGSALGWPVQHLRRLDTKLFPEICNRGLMRYKPKLMWQEDTGEIAQEDQREKDMWGMTAMDKDESYDRLDFGTTTDPCISSSLSDEGKDFHELFGGTFPVDF